tara:strand:+ start:393 stop:593 length:201 start_codon:yes stop_codon:yes gene_type:complete
MKNLILNNGKIWNRNFLISGLIIPNFGSPRGGIRFDSKEDAQLTIDSMPSNIAKDCKIIRDIWNIK